MKNHFLTYSNILKGKLFGIIEVLFSKSRFAEIPQAPGFTAVKWLKVQNNDNGTSIGFSSYQSKKVVIKHLQYGMKNALYEQLINEMNMLKLFSRLLKSTSNTYMIKVPSVYMYKEVKHTAFLVSEFVEGKLLFDKSNETKLTVIKVTLSALENMTSRLDKKTQKHLPKRDAWLVYFSFPVYFAKVLYTDKKQWKKYIHFLTLFYKNFAFRQIFSSEYVLAHKDLHSKNILLNGKTIILIDPEVSVLTLPQTDIAHIARYYATEFSQTEMMQLLNDQLTSQQEKQMFVALTIFYAIQMMSMRKTNDPDYTEASTYLFHHFLRYYDGLLDQNMKSIPLGERAHLLVLRSIAFITRKLTFQNTNPVILCYHAIEKDAWRYSVDPNEFIKQMQYIRKYKKIVSLDEMLSKRAKDTIAITFDDGYKTVFENALPVLKKYSIPATFFVLGNPAKANRDELQNDKQLLTVKEIISLKKMGYDIGFHTATHDNLASLSLSGMKKEITEGKKQLEKTLGFSLRYFAYPKGEYTKKIVQVVKKAGFIAAFSTDGGAYTSSNDTYTIDRICVERGFGLDQFTALISPVGITYNKSFTKLIQFKYQLQTQLA